MSKKITISQVRDIRILLELNALRIGGHSILPSTLSELRSLVDRMGKCCDTKEHMILNEEFHVTLSKCGGEVYSILLRPILKFYQIASICITPDDKVIELHNSNEHYNIIESLSAGDVEQACCSLRSHILNAYVRFENDQNKFLQKSIQEIISSDIFEFGFF